VCALTKRVSISCCQVVLDYVGYANGVLFEDTRERGKPIVFPFQSRPFTGGMCVGVEQALATMNAGSIRRVVRKIHIIFLLLVGVFGSHFFFVGWLQTVPPELGFGSRGTVLRPTEHVPEKQGIVPPDAELVYHLELIRISIPPS
jgi:FKBP-type peptidyl-prolyl cis-trans isomerase